MTGTRPWQALAQSLEARPQAWTRARLCRQYGTSALSTALARGAALRVLDGVYASPLHARTTLVRAHATALWLGDRGVVGGSTVAFLASLTPLDPRVVHVFGRPRVHIRGPAWMQIRHRSPTQTTMTVQGVEVAGPTDVAIQAWEQLGPSTGRDVVIETVRREFVTAPAIAERTLSYPTLQRRGPLIPLLEDLAGGIDSFLELHAARDVLVGSEFAGIDRHVRIGPLRRKFEADFYHAGARLDVETDGKRYHNDDARRRRDLERDAILASVGIQTIRLTFEDVMGRPRWCRRMVADAIRARSGMQTVPPYG